MPASKSGKAKKASPKKIRVVKNTKAAKAPRRKASVKTGSKSNKKAPQRTSVRNTRSTPRGKVKVFTDVPGWNDLVKEENKRLVGKKEEGSFFGAISTLRFTLGVLAVACVFTLYVGHVYATQDLLAEVQSERKDNLSLRLEYNRTKGLYDAAIGPAVIHQRARELGLEEKMISGPPVQLAQR